VLARVNDHVVLGIQAVGQAVSERSTASGIAIEMGARLEDIAVTIHSHPTQGEAVDEASLKALGRFMPYERTWKNSPSQRVSWKIYLLMQLVF
jgi:hypothetical protein